MENSGKASPKCTSGTLIRGMQRGLREEHQRRRRGKCGKTSKQAGESRDQIGYLVGSASKNAWANVILTNHERTLSTSTKILKSTWKYNVKILKSLVGVQNVVLNLG